MNKTGYLRLAVLSLVSALFFGLLSLLVLNWLTESVAERHRAEYLGMLAESVERAIADVPDSKLADDEIVDRLRLALHRRAPSPAPQPTTHSHPRPNLWLLSDDGRILFADDKAASTGPWDSLPKPKEAHEVAHSGGILSVGAQTWLIKLDRKPDMYLVLRDEHRPFMGPYFGSEVMAVCASLILSLALSLSITFIYLRRKSRQASRILARLEGGDLKARFPIQGFDEFGGLMLDFNRMAEAIEHLVARVHASESARNQLLQELGHDLRTPLTSLTTSFENIKFHFAKLSEAQRADLFEMMGAEVAYLGDLLEKLMTIAGLNEPNFKGSTEVVNLTELLKQEVALRQTSGPSKEWDWTGEAPLTVSGDAHLLRRLFKNAFDNASRFAHSRVGVEAFARDGFAVVQIDDDGPGLSSDALASFGRRREQRTRRNESILGFSLGLGSVIMKAIAELHAGEVTIANSGRGARLIVRIPILRHS
jgi:signal transduction histidine kinase